MEGNYLKIKTEKTHIAMEWLGLVDSIDYRKGHLEFLNTIGQNRNPFWLLNYRESDNIKFADRKWTLEEWLPQAIKVVEEGVEKIAVIVPKNIFNKISVRILTANIQKQQEDINIAFFHRQGKAKEWLTGETYEEDALSAN